MSCQSCLLQFLLEMLEDAANGTFRSTGLLGNLGRAVALQSQFNDRPVPFLETCQQFFYRFNQHGRILRVGLVGPGQIG